MYGGFQHIINLSTLGFDVFVPIDDSMPTLRMYVNVKLEWCRAVSEIKELHRHSNFNFKAIDKAGKIFTTILLLKS